MTVTLAADVGGTNARFAVMEHGRPLAPPRSVSNRAHPGFVEAAAAYLADISAPQPEAVCAAFAGPVQDGRAALTNHHWTVEARAMAAALGARTGLVLNDLAALGHGLHLLDAEAAPTLDPGGDAGNGQRLAVGVGTGMNVCAVLSDPDGARRALSAEYGHAGLPEGALALLPETARGPASVEDRLSGRGLSRLHAELHGGAPLPPERIVAGAGAGDAAAAETCRRFAALAGALCRDLALQYLPLDGLFLAGSVARGALGAPGAAESFVAAARAHPDPRFAALIARVPLRLVRSDLAALAGCAAAAEAALEGR